MGKRESKLAASSQEKKAWLLELVTNTLGPRPIADIKAPDILAVLSKIEARGRYETARRAKQCIGMVFRYAVATGRAERGPSADLRGALTPPASKPCAAVTAPGGVAGLLRDRRLCEAAGDICCIAPGAVCLRETAGTT